MLTTDIKTSNMLNTLFLIIPIKRNHLNMCALRIIFFTVRRELEETGHFECMDLTTDEEEHSIEMQLPFIAKVMEGYV